MSGEDKNKSIKKDSGNRSSDHGTATTSIVDQPFSVSPPSADMCEYVPSVTSSFVMDYSLPIPSDQTESALPSESAATNMQNNSPPSLESNDSMPEDEHVDQVDMFIYQIDDDDDDDDDDNTSMEISNSQPKISVVEHDGVLTEQQSAGTSPETSNLLKADQDNVTPMCNDSLSFIRKLKSAKKIIKMIRNHLCTCKSAPKPQPSTSTRKSKQSKVRMTRITKNTVQQLLLLQMKKRLRKSIISINPEASAETDTFKVTILFIPDNPMILHWDSEMTIVRLIEYLQINFPTLLRTAHRMITVLPTQNIATLPGTWTLRDAGFPKEFELYIITDPCCCLDAIL